ncbi:hypothetical protein [Arthrobacter sp. zg-Y895]|uniref:hypothetical protein n=1 Tax=Arthrobacter sp. zg-Y895 TaxID=2886933 RepID=UPI001D137024|nr:hypothetical protein [Arthrobacter sp. zg-Y895]MCC3302860.1 hypothetical protein [Arthrobacter sp. zg-Y895]
MGETMHIPRLSTAASALPIAALLLMGPVSPAQALECAPGYLPAVVDGVETCVVSTYSPAVPVPSYNPGESHYDPSTGNYSEAVPAVPVPAGPSAPAEPTPEATPSTVPPSPASTGSTGGTTGGGAGGNSSVGTPSPSSSRTASPSPSATDAVEEERTASDLALPAIAAVVILGLLAGGLLLRHRNRSRD